VANLAPHNLVFDRFATDESFRKRLWIAFGIWVFSKLGDSGTDPKYFANLLDLYGKILKTPLNVNHDMQLKVQQVASHIPFFYDEAITDGSLFAAFEFAFFQVLYAYGYIDIPTNQGT
jgi:hypothetical protein